MQFQWPAQRYDRLTTAAAIVATALTTCAGFVIVLASVRVYRAAESHGPSLTEERIERITFEHPDTRPVAPTLASKLVRLAAPHATSSPATPIDTSSLITNRVESSAHAAPAAKPLSTEPGAAASRALGPYSASVAITIGRIDSGAAPPLPFGLLPPTQAERDAIGRAGEQRAETSREAHRPMPIRVGGVSVPMPFGGAVRSRAQRSQDSVLQDEYLRRLARLAERVRAKRESTLAARTVARKDSAPR
jgi:hypothetical protein